MVNIVIIILVYQLFFLYEKNNSKYNIKRNIRNIKIDIYYTEIQVYVKIHRINQDAQFLFIIRGKPH